jgi:hypothetical protein
MAGGNKVITGLTGMTQEDLGRYITLYECTDDNAGHYEIVTVTSATQVTVTRTANFTADSAVKWKVSKHPGTWDFYNGDRYQNNLLSETWARNTLLGGIVSDAELTQAIADLREFTGEDPHQTTPTLTNTGNYFPWSDLLDIANTNLEELCNTLNAQIGNRDYSAEALGNVPNLADGQTITESIEYIAVALGQSQTIRVIKRVTSIINKWDDVVIPGGNTYKTGTSDGQSLYVYWRGLLRDPGTVANGDDYTEKNNTTITVYSEIRNGDHINFFITAND